MAIRIEFLGHATFLISDGTHRVLIDPFLTGNPRASVSADEVDCTHIVCTHGHDDHFADAAGIAKRTGATVYAGFELANRLGEDGVEKLEPGGPGGRIDAPFGFVAFTPAIHSSSSGGRYLGVAMGAVVNIGGVSIYDLGDTALFSDLKLMGELYRPRVALYPVGDRFTMGPEHATRAAEWVGAPIAIPKHYGTWPLLRSDISAFRPAGVEVRALEPGESIEV